MTRWLAAARQAQQAGTQLTKPTKPPQKEVSSVMSVMSEGVSGTVAGFWRGQATPLSDPAPPPTQAKQAFPYGTSAGGRPRTYTGRIVSLADWSSLTEWEKHGPNGRLWNGITKQWESPK